MYACVRCMGLRRRCRQLRVWRGDTRMVLNWGGSGLLFWITILLLLSLVTYHKPIALRQFILLLLLWQDRLWRSFFFLARSFAHICQWIRECFFIEIIKFRFNGILLLFSTVFFFFCQNFFARENFVLFALKWNAFQVSSRIQTVN